MMTIEEKTKLYNEYRDYIQTRYDSAYIGDISKLNAKNQYDENGLLKSEYFLTEEEKNALLYNIPDIRQSLKPLHKQDDIYEKYQKFLFDVEMTTNYFASIISLGNFSVGSGNVKCGFDILGRTYIYGIERESYDLIEKYGRTIYDRASNEVPYKVEYKNGENKLVRDFFNANRKIGYINAKYSYGDLDKTLVDLELLVNLLNEKGIPSYFDFETNMFYFNSIPSKKKTK